MMIRVDEDSLTGFKEALRDFLPHYLTFDMGLPDYTAFQVGFGDFMWGLFTWHVELYDISYAQVQWDFDLMNLNMTKNEIYDMPFVSF
jgi:hypothetical protein